MTDTKLLYEQNDFPLFQNRVYETAAEARSCARGDIRIVENADTGLIYNAAFLPELMNYDSHYDNEQSNSPRFQEHLENVAGVLERTMGKEEIVEVGCGKGRFLELLLSRGFDLTGFDPTYEGNNPRVQRKYFGADTGVRGRGLILRHVLEHIQNPADFLSSLNEANGGDGLIYIEVPCFEWICQRRAWFDIFYEHVNYFRLGDFDRMFGNVIESGHIFGGQYIYVVAELGSIRTPSIKPVERIDFPTDFTPEITLSDETHNARGVVWGAASKGVIFSLLRARQNSPVSAIIDINPAKHGKYIAGTGLLINSPESILPELADGSVIFVMNSNYLAEIRKMSGDRFRYIAIDGGR